MLPRFRSFYGKFIVFGLVALCFILYIKVLQVEQSSALSTFLGDSSRLTHLRDSQPLRHQNENHNPLERDRIGSEEESENNANEVLEDDDDHDNDEQLRHQGQHQHERRRQHHRGQHHQQQLQPQQADQEQAPPAATGDDDENVNRDDWPLELSVRLDLARQQPGLGDKGEAAELHGRAKERGDQIYAKIALNEELSEHLSYNRTLKDSRHPLCKTQHYDTELLPTASVIIIFYNEPFSVLLRTVHSTLNTCQGRILKEIILVDDGSDEPKLGEKLDYYVKTRLPAGKVQILRLKNRLGLIRARLAGARIATGDVLIFLDAHCEANIGWCEPLLQRIHESRTSVLVPIIDVIDAKDFQYSTNGYKSFQVGGFQWSGHFDWINLSAREKKRQMRECKQPREVCPAYSPTMAGGLFAIDRHYFWESGSYDEQMDGWGGENLEMSFRIWQCGGTIETIPCSRVGHVFRDFHPYKFPNDRDTHGINTARMALVWMDEYINMFFLNRPDLKFNPDIGDVTHRIMLRKKLRCKSFDWYLKNIYPEKFVPNKNVIAYGRVRAVGSNICFDDLLQNNESPYNLGLFQCGKKLTKSQLFSFTKNHVLRNELSCATVQHSSSPPYLVVMVPCLDRDDYNDQWQWQNEQLMHVNTGLCLDRRGLKSMDNVQAAVCDSESEFQRWNFERD